MAKSWFQFIMDGITSSGSHTGGASPVRVYAENATEARQKAKASFKNTRHAVTITKCENVTKKK